MPTKPNSHRAEEVQANQRAYNRRRGSAASRGYDSRWDRYSEAYRRAHPLCARCEAKGLIVAVEVVGHIVPVPPSDPRFLEPHNHIALCQQCNAIQRELDFLQG